MHPNDACPSPEELAAAAAALCRLRARPSDRQGVRNRSIVLLSVLSNDGAHARLIAAKTNLPLQQVARAIVFLEKAGLLSRRNNSDISKKIRCCYVTRAGAEHIKTRVVPESHRP